MYTAKPTPGPAADATSSLTPEPAPKPTPVPAPEESPEPTQDQIAQPTSDSSYSAEPAPEPSRSPFSVPIKIVPASAEKAYDGEPLVERGYFLRIAEDSLLSAEPRMGGSWLLSTGDVLTAIIVGSQTEIGVSENLVSAYRIMRGDAEVTGQYKVQTLVGKLEVTKP